LRPTDAKSAEQKHAASKQAPSGKSSAPLFPTAPKFDTKGKIPAFGAPLVGSNEANHNRDRTKADSDHRTPPTVKTDNRIDLGHDRDRRDRDEHSEQRHVPSVVRGDSHDHHHSSSSGSRRSGWSWFILGAAAPLGGGWYGPGYGRTYGGWSNDVYYVPAQTYVPAVNATAPVVVDANVLPTPAPNSNEDFLSLPIARQRELLLQALNALEDDFARSPNGDEWSRQLQLATAAKLIGEGDTPTEPVTRTRLRSIVELFDEVAANPEYRPVSELLSFRSLQAGLREFASEPIGQARNRLSRAADRLSQQLKTWPNGDRWKDYLQLPWLVGSEEEERLEMPERLVRFEKLLAKFDRVKADDQFRVVSQEQTFGATHTALRGFVRELQFVVQPSETQP
jgi:hypothetical protein